ncbi:hypothetical protein BK703_16650 [Bacillus thuringiensis serovar silo]|uniref:hypothetical protein n=1 Tax=Bacillus thuringiensis TaxID=1428 RepID=UPI000A39C0B5|nr:hypothetical protein [Bacillus thuringiensis]MDA2128700.1 hypothetical protein [Bacillus cereus]MED3275356.1 hypothetical protein [Bacillus thuringiensis]OTW55267.1 hypothetical protein BK703_16650 [Bacillus thuringiensis serovar silo]OTW74301.1 hypothetical protein BK700_01395 [Bacillus thuringiensis serovar toguchini]
MSTTEISAMTELVAHARLLASTSNNTHLIRGAVDIIEMADHMIKETDYSKEELETISLMRLRKLKQEQTAS